MFFQDANINRFFGHQVGNHFISSLDNWSMEKQLRENCGK